MSVDYPAVSVLHVKPLAVSTSNAFMQDHGTRLLLLALFQKAYRIELCVEFDAPCFKEDFDKLKWVPRRATKTVRGLETKLHEK